LTRRTNGDRPAFHTVEKLLREPHFSSGEVPEGGTPHETLRIPSQRLP
jgi:hypothetical protein